MIVYHVRVYQGLTLIDHLVRTVRGSLARSHLTTSTRNVVVNEAGVLPAHVVGLLSDPRHLGRWQLVIHDDAGFSRAYILTTCLANRLTLARVYVLQVSLIPQGCLGGDISGTRGIATCVNTPRIRQLQGVIFAWILTALRKPYRPSSSWCCFHHIGIIQRINFNNTIVNQKIILLASFFFTRMKGMTRQFLSMTSGSTTVPTPSTQTSNF